MKKNNIMTISEKNEIVNNIIKILIDRMNFLIIGHENPDDDCIASMVAMALLIKKLAKKPYIIVPVNIQERYHYLLNICLFNSIELIKDHHNIPDDVDAIISLDTPKPTMIQSFAMLKDLIFSKNIIRIEIDHHQDSDSEYIGDKGYQLVVNTSSASEIVGYLALKIQKKQKYFAELATGELFTRNLVLAILTGIVGDSQMGKFLKSHQELCYYKLFSTMFSRMLSAKTDMDSANFSSMKEIYAEMTRLSKLEEECFQYFHKKKQKSKHIAYVILDNQDTGNLPAGIDNDALITSARAIADKLAEESGYLSLVIYYDIPDSSDLIQFRIRRSQVFKEIDLREILKKFKIKNGGGHAGAIGFRIEKNKIQNIHKYAKNLIKTIELMCRSLI